MYRYVSIFIYNIIYFIVCHPAGYAHARVRHGCGRRLGGTHPPPFWRNQQNCMLQKYSVCRDHCRYVKHVLYVILLYSRVYESYTIVIIYVNNWHVMLYIIPNTLYIIYIIYVTTVRSACHRIVTHIKDSILHVDVAKSTPTCVFFTHALLGQINRSECITSTLESGDIRETLIFLIIIRIHEKSYKIN